MIESSPELSIVIPARDEEHELPACLDAVEEAAKRFKGALEVVVVVNRCRDRTEEIARSRGCRVVSCDAKNLSVIRNVGVFFFSRDAFEEIGGFDESLKSAEDIDFARRLKVYGKKHKKRFKILLRAHIVTSVRKFDHFGDWYFLCNPRLVYRLLRGQDSKAADRVWYNIKR